MGRGNTTFHLWCHSLFKKIGLLVHLQLAYYASMVEMILKKTLFRVSTQTKLWICIHALGGSCSFWIQANLHHSDKLFDIGYVDKSEFDETTSEYLHNIYLKWIDLQLVRQVSILQLILHTFINICLISSMQFHNTFLKSRIVLKCSSHFEHHWHITLRCPTPTLLT